jgi:endonuclease-8
MPEGHTVRRLADRHWTLFGGRRVAASSPQGRFADGAALISGQVLESTDAYGKHLLHRYTGERWLHVHLGLYGRFTDGAGVAPPPVGEVRLRIVGSRYWLDLRGPAACELLAPPEVKALIGRLGADPLRSDASPEAAYERIRRSAKPIASLLLDQSIVAGTGLIYVTEALFRAGIAPTTLGRSVTASQLDEIWADLRTLMRAGVETGRIDTVHLAHTPEAMGRAPRMDPHGGEVYVYRRTGQPCLVCSGPVRTAPLGGRNSYWCTTCQPPP